MPQLQNEGVAPGMNLSYPHEDSTRKFCGGRPSLLAPHICVLNHRIKASPSSKLFGGYCGRGTHQRHSYCHSSTLVDRRHS